MPTQLDELHIENLAFDLFAEAEHSCMRGTDLDDASERLNTSSVILDGRAQSTLPQLNPLLPEATVDFVVASLSRPPHPMLIDNNRWFYGLITDGVPVECKEGKTGEMRGGRSRLIDFEAPDDNDFLAVRQLTSAGAHCKSMRSDPMLYVNGLPLVVIELKDPSNTAATLDVAIDQLGKYKTALPDLLVTNLLVASDGLLTRVSSIEIVRIFARPFGRRDSADAEATRVVQGRRDCGMTTGQLSFASKVQPVFPTREPRTVIRFVVSIRGKRCPTTDRLAIDWPISIPIV